ncbi:phosphatase PAP2 family protein [Planosporangium sp. 12N6]|uniref:phosphatase PAP2 family protein n=1 Tax=Planosporangium spinosum TaxID=3402278 RepID=UPI003CFA11FB
MTGSRGSAASALRPGTRSRVASVSRPVLVAVAVLLATFGLVLLLVEAAWRPLAGADTGLRDGLYRYALRHPGFVTGMKVVSNVGSSSVYLVLFAVVVGWMLWRRRYRLAVYVVVTVVGSSLLNNAVKIGVHRARPVLPHPVAHANGMSFPSGHAQAAMVTCAVLLLVVILPRLRRPWSVLAAAGCGLMVLAIGFSRIALGVHYLSDVVAGYLLGAAWVTAMTAAFGAVRIARDARSMRPG